MPNARSEPDLAHPGLPALGDALDFLRRIWAVDHAPQRRSTSIAVALGITLPQRLVIRIVGRFPGIHPRQLAETQHLHPSSLTDAAHPARRRNRRNSH